MQGDAPNTDADDDDDDDHYLIDDGDGWQMRQKIGSHNILNDKTSKSKNQNQWKTN